MFPGFHNNNYNYNSNNNNSNQNYTNHIGNSNDNNSSHSHSACQCNSVQRMNSRSSIHRSNVIYVEVHKGRGEALGITLRLSSSGRCIVGRIMHGGLIHKTGMFQIRDELQEINGSPIFGHSIESVQQFLISFEGTLVFKVAHSKKSSKPSCQMFVRSMFDYDPNEDDELPCAGIGLSFGVGTILEIVDHSDFTWWQARRTDGSSDSDETARLIPSAEFQESRVVKATSEELDFLEHGDEGSGSFSHYSIPFLNRLHKKFSSNPRVATNTSFDSSQNKGFSSTDLSVVAQLERTFCRWMPFRRKSLRETRARSRDREAVNNASKSMKHSRSTEAINFGCATESHSGKQQGWKMHNGGQLSIEDFDTPSQEFSQTCSYCNSTLQVSSSSTRNISVKSRNSRSIAGLVATPFLFSELDFQPYEEVVQLTGFHRRSLVLLGAYGVGRRTLRKALVSARQDLFGAAVSHTTRSPEPYEIDGVHYYFVQESEMASYILNKEFLEYGRKKNILFGTRLDSVRDVMGTGRLPVLDVEPKALQILRSAEFAPIVIFVAPPCLEVLLRNSNRDMLNDSLKKLAKESEIMEYVYRPYIDQVIVHHNVDDSTQEIIDYIINFQESQQWVPITWIY